MKKLQFLFLMLAVSWGSYLGYSVSAQPLEGIRTMQYSPDGSMLAISGVVNSTTVFYVVEANNHNNIIADFSSNTVITKFGALSVSWSPDGTRIVTTSPGNRNKSIYVWSVSYSGFSAGSLITSSSDILLNLGSGLEVQWSPDGQYILASYFDGIGLWEVSADSLNLMDTLHTHALDFAWHPDGDKFALATRVGAIVLQIDDETIANTPFEQAAIGQTYGQTIGSISWNSDGSKIAFGSFDSDVTDSIYVYDYSSSLPSQLFQVTSTNMIYELVWSDDENWLAAITTEHEVTIWNTESGDLLPSQPILVDSTLFTLDWNPLTTELIYAENGTEIITLDPTIFLSGD